MNNVRGWRKSLEFFLVGIPSRTSGWLLRRYQ